MGSLNEEEISVIRGEMAKWGPRAYCLAALANPGASQSQVPPPPRPAHHPRLSPGGRWLRWLQPDGRIQL